VIKADEAAASEARPTADATETFLASAAAAAGRPAARPAVTPRAAPKVTRVRRANPKSA
jgi:hypothetical protein